MKRAATAAVVLMVALCAPIALAAGLDTVFLKNGGRLRGQVMVEDAKEVSILLDDGTTRIVPRADVLRVEYAADAAPQPPRVTPPPAPPAAPPPGRPCARDTDCDAGQFCDKQDRCVPIDALRGTPGAAPPATPPPGPMGPSPAWSEGDEPDAPRRTRWMQARRGVHFGVSAMGAYIPGLDAGGGAAEAIMNIGFGVLDLRLALGYFGGGSDTGYATGPMITVETRFNLGSIYSLGAGPLVGVSIEPENGRGTVGPIFGVLATPAVFRLGPDRNFEVGLTGGPLYNPVTEFVGGMGGFQFSVLF